MKQHARFSSMVGAEVGGMGCTNRMHFVLYSEEVFELFTVVVVGLITLLYTA